MENEIFEKLEEDFLEHSSVSFNRIEAGKGFKFVLMELAKLKHENAELKNRIARLENTAFSISPTANQEDGKG